MTVLQLALKEYGLFEYAGATTHPRLRKIFNVVQKYIDFSISGMDDSKIAWCGIFMTYLFDQANLGRYIPKGPQGAKSWKQLRTIAKEITIDEAQPGDLVIFWRGRPDGWKGHVALYINNHGHDKIRTLGGNQSNGVVIRSYKKSQIEMILRLPINIKK